MTKLEQLRALLKAATPTETPGYYVTREGVVLSTSGWRGEKIRILKASVHDGYYVVRLAIAGKRRKVMVHRLVAIAFHGRPQAGQQVRHLDGDRLNNRAGNLAWGTVAENAQDRERHGRGTSRQNGRIGAAKQRRTHCKRGHRYSRKNRDGTNHCRLCVNTVYSPRRAAKRRALAKLEAP